MLLGELALDFSDKWLKPDGALLVKMFQGEGFDEFRKAMGRIFATVAVRKPKASRERSNELYLLGRTRKHAELAETAGSAANCGLPATLAVSGWRWTRRPTQCCRRRTTHAEAT